MAIYRTVSMTFWTDRKVVDDFTAEDKYFYLYLFTNPHTNLCGCYEISIKQVANEMGYSKDAIENLIDRFEKTHNVIRFSKETKEILLLNWHKYNWTSSEKFRKPLLKEIESIKDDNFRKYLEHIYNKGETRYGIDTTCIDTFVTVTDTVTVSDTDSNTDTDINTIKKDSNLKYIKEIVQYLNNRCGTKYRYQTKETKEHINARLREGYTVDDFKDVIDKKAEDWMNTEREKYLRPQTLFGTKFESYLNQKRMKNPKDVFDEWRNA